jgi:hypothetical protein
VQAPGRRPLAYGGRAEPQILQLRQAEHAVLAARECGQGMLGI